MRRLPPLLACVLLLAGCPWLGEDLTAVADPVAYRSVTLGAATTCGVTDDREAYCWGTGDDVLGSVRPSDWCFWTNGQEGMNFACSKRPIPVYGGHQWERVVLGGGTACAIDKGGSLSCWGGNDQGQLARPPTEETSAGGPRKIDGLDDVVSVALGGKAVCAVAREGELWCWGAKTKATEAGAGFPAGTLYVRPFQVGGSRAFAQVALGDDHGCALTVEGTIECWGSSAGTTLGSARPAACPGDVDWCLLPVQVPLPGRFVQISAEGKRTCAVAEGGALWCWSDTLAPSQLATSVASVALGAYESMCTLSLTGRVGCQGGYLSTPASLASRTYQSVAVNGWTACAVDVSGASWCWGSNAGAEFGDGTQISSGEPVMTSAPYKD